MKYKDISARFSKLQMKERRLIMIAGIGGILLLGYTFVVDPAQQKAALQKTQRTQQQTELATLQTELVGLRQQAAHPDAQLRKEIEDTVKQIAGIEGELREFDNLLVSPAQMPRMLQSLLTKNRGLELVSLKTLPTTPLLAPPDAAKPVPATQAQPAPVPGAKPLPPPGGIYRHAIEITIAGSYADLLRYAEELQHISPRPLWSGMKLKVVEYPRSELTFTLYTLSLDLPWLAV